MNHRESGGFIRFHPRLCNRAELSDRIGDLYRYTGRKPGLEQRERLSRPRRA